MVAVVMVGGGSETSEEGLWSMKTMKSDSDCLKLWHRQYSFNLLARKVSKGRADG